MKVSDLLRPDFAKLDDYKPVKPLDQLAAEIGIPVKDLVKLDANENPYGPHPAIREAIASADLHIYPDPGQTHLRKALAEYLGHDTDVNQIVAGCGSDDLIDIIMRVTDCDSVVIASPTFGMYSFLGKLNKSNIIDVPRIADQGFALDMPKMLAAIDEAYQRTKRAPVVFLPSPCNPTGQLLPQEHARALLDKPCLVIVDEAYAEFVEDQEKLALPLLKEQENVIILRTFSKWAGLAGIRVGFGVMHKELARRCMAIKQPYNLNVGADLAAQTALAKFPEIHKDILAMVEQRKRMSSELGKLEWLEPLPTESNFVLFKVTHGRSAKAVALQLRQRGVFIRYWSTPTLQHYIRISTGTKEQIDILLETIHKLDSEKVFEQRADLKQIMNFVKPQAFLFDMDGVLAEVSQSYRECIIQTAKELGAADVSHEEISACKAQGGCNDDWHLTLKLVTKRGIDTTLEAVTDIFERLYNGTDSTPGLYKTETLRIPEKVIAHLAHQMPLGIVTGRPRDQALRFLKDFGIESYFSQLVCMHEAPSKPDPAPVRLCMEKLQVASAVFLGDTVDDIRAGKAANATALGVLAAAAASKDTLYDAGAELVLDDPKDLEVLLQ